MRMPRPLFAAAIALVSCSACAAPAQVVPTARAEPSRSFADLADLTLAAPVIADAVVRSSTRIKGAEAVGLAPGLQRFYVTADVSALIRGAAGLQSRIGYVVDLPADARGRVANLKKTRMLLFVRPVAGSADQVQLVAPGAQLPWTAAADATVRQLAQAALAPDAPPPITGVGSAFHVPGALPGEGETQVFLQTGDARPVSLSILRRPGEQPRWSVSLGEIVDESAGPPARDTLLWYRLACGLPAALPEASTAELEAAAATVAREDYQFVIDALGPCGRSTGGAAPA
jgi:hypothetical protein